MIKMKRFNPIFLNTLLNSRNLSDLKRMGMKKGESGQLDSGWDRLIYMLGLGRIKHVLIGHG